jgi:large subunit ribosomal protein L22
MTGPKRNEGATVVGENTGSRSVAKHVRVSSYKVREVLNLIRGLEVHKADEILQFTERDAARDVRKVLASAVANAIHNDELDPDELFIRAAFADEGPTQKRFRPRARGRASRIRKRTAHITVIVDRMSDDALARKAAKESARTTTPGRGRRVAASTAQSRRDRVASSRAAAAGRLTGGSSKASDATTKDADAGEQELHPYGAGSHAPLDDDAQPEGFEIKGNADSMLYHTTESRFYKQTKAEVWFATEEDAEAAGFSKPKSQAEAEAADTDDKPADDEADDATTDAASNEPGVASASEQPEAARGESEPSRAAAEPAEDTEDK